MSEVNCLECEGVCCRKNTLITFQSPDEEKDKNVIQSNIELIETLDFPLRTFEKYIFINDCPHLKQQSNDNKIPEYYCGIYSDQTRPSPCSGLKAGDAYCLFLRYLYGYKDEITETQIKREVDGLTFNSEFNMINTFIDLCPKENMPQIIKDFVNELIPNNYLNLLLRYKLGYRDTIVNEIIAAELSSAPILSKLMRIYVSPKDYPKVLTENWDNLFRE